MDKDLDIQVAEVLKAYMASGVEDQVDYKKFYLYSIVTHSTAIEGSTVTEIENQLLFDDGIAANGRSLTEQMMNIDLKSCFMNNGRESYLYVSVIATTFCPRDAAQARKPYRIPMAKYDLIKKRNYHHSNNYRSDKVAKTFQLTKFNT